MNQETTVPTEVAATNSGYMEALLTRLQDDVAARKQPRSDMPLGRVAIWVVVCSALAFELGVRSVDSSAGLLARAEARVSTMGLREQIDRLRGESAMKQATIDRLQRAFDLSTRYGIGADLAMQIEDIALAEGIDTQLAFDLVRVESRFNPNAVSPVGALGLTQLMPATAEALSPGITRQQIFDRETNLRLGFRFFKSLLTYYKGDVRLALLAYNRGPTTVDRLLAAGEDPSNGYASAVLGTKAN